MIDVNLPYRDYKDTDITHQSSIMAESRSEH